MINRRQRRNFSDDFKREVLSFVKEHGIMQASKHFDIHTAVIGRWKHLGLDLDPKQENLSLNSPCKRIHLTHMISNLSPLTTIVFEYQGEEFQIEGNVSFNLKQPNPIAKIKLVKCSEMESEKKS